jgi:hypothetical protein
VWLIYNQMMRDSSAPRIRNLINHFPRDRGIFKRGVAVHKAATLLILLRFRHFDGLRHLYEFGNAEFCHLSSSGNRHFFDFLSYYLLGVSTFNKMLTFCSSMEEFVFLFESSSL